MEAMIRRVLAMASRAVEFATAHPSTDSGFVAVIGRVTADLTRGEALALQEREGRLAEAAAVQRRRELRTTTLAPMMRHLTVVGELAARGDPPLAARFAHPTKRVPNKAFITAARSMLQAATDQKEELLAVGLGDKFLDEFGAAITEFDARMDDANSGRRQHIGARADLLAVADDVLQQIHVLDGLVRSEYRNDPELLAAWASARNVVRPVRAGGRRAPLAPHGNQQESKEAA